MAGDTVPVKRNSGDAAAVAADDDGDAAAVPGGNDARDAPGTTLVCRPRENALQH